MNEQSIIREHLTFTGRVRESDFGIGQSMQQTVWELPDG